MRKSLDTDIILEIATELGVAPSFIEKDWYAVQVIKLISGYSTNEITPILSGGTSLSKGYGLIQRFSEDIDFQIMSKIPTNRMTRRTYRTEIIDLINNQEEFSVDIDNVESANNSNFFSFNISYPKTQELDNSLRANLQLEMSFKQGVLPVENCNIQSFVAQFTKEDAETNIDCISPAKTAADKFSALLWRINARDHNQRLGDSKNDPTIIRHLHDLSALEEIALTDQNFVSIVHATFAEDSERGGVSKDLSLKESAKKALHDLGNYKAYRNEYRQFVDAMSYASEQDRINFETARASFKRIIDIVTGKTI